MTPKNTARLIKHLPFKKVFELGWDEQLEIEELGIKILGVPVKHWGNRYPWNRRYGYNGYLIEKKGTRIFFPGDTAFTDQFRKLSDTGGGFCFYADRSLFPRSFAMGTLHAGRGLGHVSRYGCEMVGSHSLGHLCIASAEPLDEPLERLMQAAGQEAGRIVFRKHGDTFMLSKEKQKKPDSEILNR